MDTYVDEDQASINFAEAAELQVARTVEFFTLRRSYLRFNLGTIPSNAIVTNAALRLYLSSASGPTVTVYVHPVNAAWNSNTLTWNNQPAVGAALLRVGLRSGRNPGARGTRPQPSRIAS